MTIEEIVSAIQSRVGLEVDGRAGPVTWLAIYRHYFPDTVPESHPKATTDAADISTVDPRSEGNIRTLHERVQPLARALIQAAAAHGITAKVTSGTRTYEEQDALYRQAQDGRDNDGDGRVDESDERVTRARAGFSNHNFGLAFDITLFDGSKPVYESPLYKVLGALGQGLGLTWGGSWSSINDEPHFELKPTWAKNMSESGMVAALRERHDLGRDQFA